MSTEKQTITGNGGTAYTLQQSVSQASDIEVFVNNTRQEPTVAYTASGTTLTMTGAVNSSDSFYVIFQGKAIQTAGLPVDAAITASTITTTGNITSSGTITGTFSGNGALVTGLTNTPCFSATFSSPLNNISNNIGTKVRFNSATFNQGGGTFDTSNYRYTPGVAGVYMFGASVNMKDAGDNSDYQQHDVNIRKNGSTVFFNRIQFSSAVFQSSAYNLPLTCLGLVSMDADDYVEVWASIYGGDFDLRPEGSRFYGFKLLGTT